MRVIQAYVVILLATASGCKFDQDTTIGYAYSIPASADDWEIASLETVGMETEPIEDLAEAITVGDFPDVHSMLIIKDGKLVFEDYFNGFGRNDLHVLFSATKSYASTLIGIAIDRGDIASIHDPIADYLPEKKAFFEGGREKITIANLLTMTSGLEWDEWSTSGLDEANSHEQMMRATSQVDFVLGLALTSEPGTLFTYNTGLSNLMAPIIEQASGESVEDYLEQNLFNKLNIESYRWNVVIDSYPSTGGSRGGLEMLPIDMAKLGQLFLDGGIWKEERIVSQEWVTEALTPKIEQSPSINYGLQWWNRTYFSKDGEALTEYDAVGDGGQWVFIFPELDLVVAFTSGNYTWIKGPDLMFQQVNMVQNYILSAIR